jgi:hypothetical protein
MQVSPGPYTALTSARAGVYPVPRFGVLHVTRRVETGRRFIRHIVSVLDVARTRMARVFAVQAGFEKVGPGLCKAATDSKQFAELTSCSPGGSDSPKLRTASARSGGT